MNLAVVGSGAVAPAGTTAEEIVVFTRAVLPAPPPAAFTDLEGNNLHVRYCPWIGAHASVVTRCRIMAEDALPRTALERLARRPIASVLVCPAPRPGFSAAQAAEIHHAIAGAVGARRHGERFGEAGVFEAFVDADELLKSGQFVAVLVTALDTAVDPVSIAADLTRPRPHWRRHALPLAEACAAMLLMEHEVARHHGLATEAVVLAASTGRAVACDDNDEAVDGTALVTVLRAVAGSEPFRVAAGQHRTDALRGRTWEIAGARAHPLLDPGYLPVAVEADLGRVGAAAGALSIVATLASLRHGTFERSGLEQSALLAWAISPDGVVGASRLRFVA